MTRKNQFQNIITALMILTGALGVGLGYNSQGSSAFLMYTIDSNLFNLIVNLLCFCSLVASKNGKKIFSERILLKFRYVATCCLGLTFLIVIFVLGPMMGYKQLLFTGPMLFNHLINPILAISSYLLLFDQPKFIFSDSLIALLPTILYGTVTITLNVLGIIIGPYPFLMVRNQSILASILWILIILLINLGIASLIQIANHSIKKRLSN